MSSQWFNIPNVKNIDSETYTVTRNDGSPIVGAVYPKNPKKFSALPGVSTQVYKTEVESQRWIPVEKKARKMRYPTAAFMDD
jgi:hypothetical protein